jgi:hypothetical protein
VLRFLRHQLLTAEYQIVTGDHLVRFMVNRVALEFALGLRLGTWQVSE